MVYAVRNHLECFDKRLAQTCVKGVLCKCQPPIHDLEKQGKRKNFTLQTFPEKLELWVVLAFPLDVGAVPVFEQFVVGESGFNFVRNMSEGQIAPIINGDLIFTPEVPSFHQLPNPIYKLLLSLDLLLNQKSLHQTLNFKVGSTNLPLSIGALFREPNLVQFQK